MCMVVTLEVFIPVGTAVGLILLLTFKVTFLLAEGITDGL